MAATRQRCRQSAEATAADPREKARCARLLAGIRGRLVRGLGARGGSAAINWCYCFPPELNRFAPTK